MDEALQIVNDIRQGVIKPIYFLFGEEAYYIDKISDYIGSKILTEEEKGFNQVVLYGKESWRNIKLSLLRRHSICPET